MQIGQQPKTEAPASTQAPSAPTANNAGSNTGGSGGGLIGGIIGGVTGIIGMMGNRRRETRARKNQELLMKQQMEYQERLNATAHQRQKEMWDYTTEEQYAKQMAGLKKAGLNPALMYEGQGQGGTTGSVGAGAASGGNAPAPAYASMDIANQVAQAAQIELMLAQARKTNAEAENITGGVRGNLEEDHRAKKFQNDINEKYSKIIERGQAAEWEMKDIEGDEKNYAWIWRKTLEYGQDNDGTLTEEMLKTRKGRQINAEVKQIEEDLKNAKATGDVTRAEAVIREFEAALTEDGISPNSPWYAKLVTELLKKIGVVDFIKKEAKR